MREKRTAQTPCANDARERIQRELECRGVSVEFSAEVARTLAPFVAELSPSSYDAVLAGVRLAYGVHARSAAASRGGAGELAEVQRLLGAFGPELQKLDEALEVLAAYVSRLRAEAAPASQTLH